MSKHDYEQEERRESHRRLEVMIQGLIDVLHTHMHDEEQDLKDMHAVLAKYFTDLDAHIHKTHHSWTGVKIIEEEVKTKFWGDIKKEVVKWIAVGMLGGFAAYMGHTMYEDAVKHIQKPVAPV